MSAWEDSEDSDGGERTNETEVVESLRRLKPNEVDSFVATSPIKQAKNFNLARILGNTWTDRLKVLSSAIFKK